RAENLARVRRSLPAPEPYLGDPLPSLGIANDLGVDHEPAGRHTFDPNRIVEKPWVAEQNCTGRDLQLAHGRLADALGTWTAVPLEPVPHARTPGRRDTENSTSPCPCRESAP